MSFNFVLEGRKGRLEEIFEEKKKVLLWLTAWLKVSLEEE